MDLLFLFEWLDSSFLATLSKAYGGVFAVVQMFHLLSMAVLGGMVLVGDLRLLNLVMTDVPSETARSPLYRAECVSIAPSIRDVMFGAARKPRDLFLV